MTPLLSIVLPTYNSGDVLEPNLSVLVPQVIAHNDVELIIINNGSTDNTQDIIDKFNNDKLSNVSCVIRKHTIDAMENFSDGVKRARGSYVLLLGDDDILSPNFISIVIPYLNDTLCVFHFNKIIGDKDFNYNTLPNPNRYSGQPIKEFARFENFLIEHTFEFNFMSSVIFKKTVWCEGLIRVPFKDFQGYQWYANIIYGAFNKPAMYYYFPLVVQRVRNRTWSTQWPLFWIGEMFSIFKDLDHYIPGIYNVWYKKHHDCRLRHFYSIMGVISQNKDLYKNKINMFQNILTSSEMKLYKILIKYPPSISKFCRFIFTIIKITINRL